MATLYRLDAYRPQRRLAGCEVRAERECVVLRVDDAELWVSPAVARQLGEMVVQVAAAAERGR